MTGIIHFMMLTIIVITSLLLHLRFTTTLVTRTTEKCIIRDSNFSTKHFMLEKSDAFNMIACFPTTRNYLSANSTPELTVQTLSVKLSPLPFGSITVWSTFPLNFIYPCS